MDNGNFTPLKTEKPKKKINKLLIFGNLFLVILVAIIGVVYYNQTLITTRERADERDGYRSESKCTCVDTTNTYCTLDQERWCEHKDESTCVDDTGGPISCENAGFYNATGWSCSRVEESCRGGGDGGGQQTCPNGQPPTCDPDSIGCVSIGQCAFPNKPVVPFESCGATGDMQFKCYTSCTCETTPTPTPTGEVTPTLTPTNTPTPTDTPTPTSTPSPTPTIHRARQRLTRRLRRKLFWQKLQ